MRFMIPEKCEEEARSRRRNCNAMGNTSSRASLCFFPSCCLQLPFDLASWSQPHPSLNQDFGHSFCYVRPLIDDCSSAFPLCPRFLESPLDSLKLVGNSGFPLDRIQSQAHKTKIVSENSFKTISGASVSANTSASHSIPAHAPLTMPPDCCVAFESTASFSALPLQLLSRTPSFYPVAARTFSSSPSGACDPTVDRTCFSNAVERGFASGPLERGHLSGPIDNADRAHFSAPIIGSYSRRKSIGCILRDVSRPVRRAISKTMSKRKWNLNRHRKSLASIHDVPKPHRHLGSSMAQSNGSSEVQWAQGKAGEDRVHIVLSEDHGWLFVGIYDGFNGPDATDFLLSNLYLAIQDELQGCLWNHKVRGESTLEKDEACSRECLVGEARQVEDEPGPHYESCNAAEMGVSQVGKENVETFKEICLESLSVAKKMHMISWQCKPAGEKTAVPFAPEQDGDVPKDRSNESRQIQDGERREEQSKTECPVALERRRKNYRNNEKPRQICRKKMAYQRNVWGLDLVQSEEPASQFACRSQVGDKLRSHSDLSCHSEVLQALARALRTTEFAFLEMSNRVIEDNPELALMGSCVLVMLMKDDDVYVMNVGDSRAILAQKKNSTLMDPSSRFSRGQSIGQYGQNIIDLGRRVIDETSVKSDLQVLQLSSDHSTSLPEEVMRIKAEHPDDESSILNGRVKGTLNVTRAFGAGFLKQPKWNDALLEMFRIDYIGTLPYISCNPALLHHKLGPHDQFLVLSSDGLYQYFTNDEVVAHVEWFMERFPEGDPAQYLLEELLFRAAKKAGMDLHELLDIPEGDRRRYYDDVTVMVVALEGRLWRSFI